MEAGWTNSNRQDCCHGCVLQVDPGQRVISTGPYAAVRHPMYTAAVLRSLGVPLALGSWWGLLPAALVVPLVVVRLLDEERMLRAELEGYEEYTRLVPWRLVPLVW